MKLIEIPAPDFDLALTLDSGQVFHWEKMGDGYVGTIGKIPAYVEQRGNALKVRCGETPQPARETRALPGIIANYFALDHRLAKIRASFPRDAGMDAARDYCRGLRIIRQPRWECLATFITSSMKQVAHIRQISHTLRRRFGRRLKLEDTPVFSYPTPARVAEVSERELRKCALGYRAKNLLATARLIGSGEVNLDALAKLTDDDLRAQLSELPGVGAKVANCVMLFAYERLRAFPIDVWIERVLKKQYFRGKRLVRREELRSFSANYFGSYGGYAQQYLFHHARKKGTFRAGRLNMAAL